MADNDEASILAKFDGQPDLLHRDGRSRQGLVSEALDFEEFERAARVRHGDLPIGSEREARAEHVGGERPPREQTWAVGVDLPDRRPYRRGRREEEAIGDASEIDRENPLLLKDELLGQFGR